MQGLKLNLNKTNQLTTKHVNEKLSKLIHQLITYIDNHNKIPQSI